MNACQAPMQTTRGYTDNFIALIEMVYGEGFLAQGGTETIDEMIQGISLSGIKMLDLGSGLGAPALYLAKNYSADIIGIDPHEQMVAKAKCQLAKAKISLKGKVSFEVMQDPLNLSQFSNDIFDLVFSKEAILHVPLEFKESFFKEIYRVMKPNAKIVIKDWMHSSKFYTHNTRKMMEMDGIAFNLLTPSEYQMALEHVGFEEIMYKDMTLQHAYMTQQNIDTITKLADELKNRFGQHILDYSLESWALQRDAFQTKELIIGCFRATKP